MPYQAKWYKEHDILMQVLEGIVTIDDVENVNRESIKLTSDGDYDFFVLIDLQNAKKMDFKFPEMLKNPIVRAATDSPRINWVIYIGSQDDPFMKFIVSVLGQSAKHHVIFKQSLDDALAFIETMRS